MKKTSAVLLFAVLASIILLITLAAFQNSPATPPEQTKAPSNISEIPTSTPSQAAALNDPTPLPVTPTPNPEAEGSFGAKGYFRIATPTGGIYNGDNLTLIITGECINQPLTMAYCLDGQERVSFGAVVVQERSWDMFVGKIQVSVTLPPLTSGQHSVTVYVTLSDFRLKQR